MPRASWKSRTPYRYVFSVLYWHDWDWKVTKCCNASSEAGKAGLPGLKNTEKTAYARAPTS